MKPKPILWCVIFMTIFNGVIAQTGTQDICEDSIITIPVESVTNDLERLGLLNDTRSDLIKKCLNHLAESIADDDKEMVYNLKEYALTLEDSVYLPLAPRELWCIDLYLNRFDNFLNDVVALDSAREAELAPKILFRTNLYYVVHNKVSDNLAAIKQAAHADANLTETAKAFIDVFLKQFDANPNNYVNIMNRESGQFLKNHPNSRYDYYVKQNLSYKFVKDPDGFQFEVGEGAGMSVLSGRLADWFSTGPATFDGDMSFGFKRYEFSFQFTVSPCESKKSFSFDDDVQWKTGGGGNIANIQFLFGRYFPINQKFVFVPHVGFAYTEIRPIYKRDDKENPVNDKKLRSFMPTIGAELRYEKLFFDSNMPCFWGPALRLTVQPIRTKIEGKAVSRALTTLSLIVKFGLCEAKRVY